MLFLLLIQIVLLVLVSSPHAELKEKNLGTFHKEGKYKNLLYLNYLNKIPYLLTPADFLSEWGGRHGHEGISYTRIAAL